MFSWTTVGAVLINCKTNLLMKNIIQFQPNFTCYIIVKYYTVPFKSFVSVRFLQVFERSLLWPRLHLFDQKYSKNSNIVKYDYHLK